MQGTWVDVQGTCRYDSGMADTNLTLRISDELKQLLAETAKAQYQTQSDFVLLAIEQRLSGACPTCGRDANAIMTQAPGLSEPFEEWLRELVPAETSDSGPVTIATFEPGGPRVYHGSFVGSDVKASLLYLRPEEKGKPHLFDRLPIARAQIVMWAHHKDAALLRTRLRNSGHFDVTASLFASAPHLAGLEPAPAPRGKRGAR